MNKYTFNENYVCFLVLFNVHLGSQLNKGIDLLRAGTQCLGVPNKVNVIATVGCRIKQLQREGFSHLLWKKIVSGGFSFASSAPASMEVRE